MPRNSFALGCGRRLPPRRLNGPPKVTHDETAIYAPIAVIATFIVGPGHFNRSVALDRGPGARVSSTSRQANAQASQKRLASSCCNGIVRIRINLEVKLGQSDWFNRRGPVAISPPNMTEVSWPRLMRRGQSSTRNTSRGRNLGRARGLCFADRVPSPLLFPVRVDLFQPWPRGYLAGLSFWRGPQAIIYETAVE